MTELKPCPFCGGSVSVAKSGDNSMMWWFITRGEGNARCNCRLFMESEDFPINAPSEEKVQLRNDLIEAWNRRYTPSEIDPFKLVEIDHVRRAEDEKSL